MKIQEWFTDGCNYQQGIELYSLLPFNPNLLRLFKQKESVPNKEKLKNELRKYLNKSVVFKEETTIPKKTPVKQEPTQPRKNQPTGKPIAFYPPELHPVYQKRIQSFYQACSLKIQLNELAEEKTEEALNLQFEIFQSWAENDKCSQILKHYEETKRILPLEVSEDYSQLTAQELVNERQRLYSRISKRKRTLTEMEKAYHHLPEGKEKNLHFHKLNQKKEELQKLHLKVEALTQRIET